VEINSAKVAYIPTQTIFSCNKYEIWGHLEKGH
jgi:hypothetical protein